MAKGSKFKRKPNQESETLKWLGASFHLSPKEIEALITSPNPSLIKTIYNSAAVLFGAKRTAEETFSALMILQAQIKKYLEELKIERAKQRIAYINPNLELEEKDKKELDAITERLREEVKRFCDNLEELSKKQQEARENLNTARQDLAQSLEDDFDMSDDLAEQQANEITHLVLRKEELLAKHSLEEREDHLNLLEDMMRDETRSPEEREQIADQHNQESREAHTIKFTDTLTSINKMARDDGDSAFATIKQQLGEKLDNLSEQDARKLRQQTLNKLFEGKLFGKTTKVEEHAKTLSRVTHTIKKTHQSLSEIHAQISQMQSSAKSFTPPKAPPPPPIPPSRRMRPH